MNRPAPCAAPTAGLSERLRAGTDQCVLCGMCLPRCPTYALARNEAESPRGRIALIAALVEGRVDPEAAAPHLDRCLECLACEDLCPAGVPYGELIDGTRNLLRDQGHRPGSRTGDWLARSLASPRGRRRLARLLTWYRRPGLRPFARGAARRLGLAAVAEAIQEPPRTRPWPAQVPARGPRRGAVALFAGCTGALLEPRVVDAAIACLTAIGYDVHLPPEQGCCGALLQHRGELDAARRVRAANDAAFAGLKVDARLFIASGCGTVLREHAPASRAWQEVCAFLADHWPDTLQPEPLDTRILLHIPCSQQRLPGAAAGPRALLERVPGAEVTELALTAGCCGAAGLYFLDQPQNARALAKLAAEEIAVSEPGVVLTTNPGCGIQLAPASPGGRVWHVVEWMAQRLPQT